MNRMVASQSAKNSTKPPYQPQTNKETKNKSPNQQSNGKIRFRPISNLECELDKNNLSLSAHTIRLRTLLNCDFFSD